MICALITKQSVDDKGPWSYWVCPAGLNREKGHACWKTPIHHQDTHLPDFQVPGPPTWHRCRSGLAHCPPSSRPSQHPYALPHLVPGHSLIGPAQCRRGRGFGWLTFRKPSIPFIAPEACKRSSCAYTFPSYSGSTDRGHKCSLLSPSLCDLPV